MGRKRKVGHRANGRGTLKFNLMFPAPVGRIRMASGTNDPEAFSDVKEMLQALSEGVPPRWDILLSIKQRRLSPMYALSLWRMGKLQELPVADLLPRVQDEYQRWIAGKEFSSDYKAQIATTFRALERLQYDACMGDLPRLLEAYREECKDADKPTQFNRAKAHVQSFVGDTLKRRHTLYLDCCDVATLDEGAATLKRPKTAAELQTLLAELPEAHARIAWGLAVTGMRPKEFFSQQWAVRPDRVHVQGTKTTSAVRDVPRWTAVVPKPERSRGRFEEVFLAVLGERMGVYDLRRSFAVWLAEAGIPAWRHPLYMGHSPKTQTAQYQQAELTAWLQEDAERLQTYAGRYLPASLGLHTERAVA